MDPTDNDSATASYDFENPINQAEDDCEVPGELVRLFDTSSSNSESTRF